MVEEIPSPRTNAPKAIYLSVICGSVSGFLFMLACVFSIQDFENVINSSTGFPFLQLLEDAIGLTGGAVLASLFIFNGFGQGISVLTSASRLTWGFARDGGLPWPSYFSHVDATWKVPARALWLQWLVVSLIGVLYLFSSTVLAAVLAVSTIALTISYAIPIAVLLAVGRERLPPRDFSLGSSLGPAANWVSMAYCAVTTVFFFFPASPGPAPGDMNYAIAVFGIMLVVSVLFWLVRGRETYLRTKDSAERADEARRFEFESCEGYEVGQGGESVTGKSGVDSVEGGSRGTTK